MRSAAAVGLLLVGGALGAGTVMLLRTPEHGESPSGSPTPSSTTNRDAESVPPTTAATTAATTPEPITGVLPIPGNPKLPGLADMEVNPTEWRFLRAALTQERVKQDGMRLDPSLGGIEVLRRVKEYGADPMAAIASWESVRSRIKVEGNRKTIEVPAEGAPLGLQELPEDIAILEFGAGTFVVDPRSQQWLNTAKGGRSLEVRGAGMDRTILVLAEGSVIAAWDEGVYENVVVRDLTLERAATGGMLIDIRGKASVALEGVRVRGWPPAGFSGAIGIQGESLLGARGCEFLGDGSAQCVLSVRGTSLAVFDHCLFADARESVVGPSLDEGLSSAVRFVDCTFENAAVANGRMKGRKEKMAFPITVRGGTVALGAEDISEEDRREAWGAGYLASLEGTTFAPGKSACSVGDIVAVLDRVSFSTTEVPYGARFLGRDREGVARYGVRTLERGSTKPGWRVVGADGVDLEKSPRNPGGGWSAPDVADIEGTTLASALRSSPIPATSSAGEVAFITMGKRGRESLAIMVRPASLGFLEWTTDVATGKILNGGPKKK